MDTSIPGDNVIYIHGSGGFNPWWSGTPMVELKKAVESHRGIVCVGPSTFYADENFFRKSIAPIFSTIISKKVHIYCREAISFNFLQGRLPSSVSIHLDHDTALSLDKSDFAIRPERSYRKAFFIRSDLETI